MEARLVSYIVCVLLLFCSAYARSIGSGSNIADNPLKSTDNLKKRIENAINKKMETGDETKAEDEEKNDKDEPEIIMAKIIEIDEKDGNRKDLYEGDILETEEQSYLRHTGHNIQGDLISNAARYWDDRQTDPDNPGWPSGIIIIPYYYDQTVENSPRKNLFKSAVNAAIAEYKEKTCIRFREQRNAPNKIKFIVGGGCYSYVGKQSSPTQEVSLGTYCETKGIAIHELMHAVGYYHEQSRPDRDLFVTINFANVRQGMEYNFQKMNTKPQGTKYDYESVMHYAANAFAIDRSQPTIIRKQGTGPLGQRNGLSTIDAESINKLYCNSAEPPKPEPGGNCQLPVTDPAFCKSVSGTGLCAYCMYNQACPDDCADSNLPIARSNCRAWADAGFCKVNAYVQYMGSTCGGSCKGNTNCRQ